jgi:acyl-CoA thioesterase I
MRSRFLLQLTLFQAISVIVMALVAFGAQAKRLPVPKETISQKTILVFGDSLSAGYGVPQGQGWVALLEKLLAAQKLNFSVVNASISGETTSGGLARFKQALLVHKPSIVLIELGANDGLRGLQIKDVQQNLNTMISQAKTANAKVLLIGMKIPPNYGLKYTKNFSQMYVNLAKQHNINLVPFLLENVAGKPELIQADGLHPLAVAQPALLENVWKVLQKVLKK